MVIHKPKTLAGIHIGKQIGYQIGHHNRTAYRTPCRTPYRTPDRTQNRTLDRARNHMAIRKNLILCANCHVQRNNLYSRAVDNKLPNPPSIRSNRDAL